MGSCRVACAVRFCDKAEGKDLVLLITLEVPGEMLFHCELILPVVRTELVEASLAHGRGLELDGV